MSAVTDMLAALDAKIATIIASPDDIASYKFGQKSVNKSEILNTLLKARAQYQAFAEVEPYEDIRHVALGVDEFGVDISEYIGETIA